MSSNQRIVERASWFKTCGYSAGGNATRVAIALLTCLAAAPAAAQLLPVPTDIDGAPVFVALAPDAIRAIDEPRFLKGEAGDQQMARDEHVLGVYLGGVARAYPLGYMSSREIVNDRFGDTPVAVTW